MYIAHTREDDQKQPLAEHLHNVADKAGDFASLWGARSVGYFLGLAVVVASRAEACIEIASAGACQAIRNVASRAEDRRNPNPVKQKNDNAAPGQ